MQIMARFRGMVAVCLLSGGMMVMPAIANPEPPTAILLAAQPVGPLTEENIRPVLTAMGNALTQKEMDGVLKFVAPFVHTEVTVESSEGTQITSFEGKEGLRDLLQAIYARIKNSTVVNQQIKIDITAGGEVGIATISTVEAITTENGNRYYSSSTDTLRFAWLNNQPTIVSMTINGWLAERPAEK
jgi:molybdopterin-binding protein